MWFFLVLFGLMALQPVLVINAKSIFIHINSEMARIPYVLNEVLELILLSTGQHITQALFNLRCRKRNKCSMGGYKNCFPSFDIDLEKHLAINPAR